MASRFVWDDRALREAVCEAAEGEVIAATAQICASANTMGYEFQTGLYHRDHKSPGVGHTHAHYDQNVEKHGGLPIGIVYTGNYAAMVDNHRNNTLLKARG